MGKSPTLLSEKPNIDTNPSTMKKKLEGAIKIRQKGQEFPANIELCIFLDAGKRVEPEEFHPQWHLKVCLFLLKKLLFISPMGF